MRYLLLFLEGIITFISPCILPMIPIYTSYFIGADHNSKFKILKNALVFVFGFTFVFTLLGAAAGTAGRFFQDHMRIINVVSGIIMILFGLNYLGVFQIKLLNRTFKFDAKMNTEKKNIFSTFVFGCIFGIGWSPCVGPFLGSALMIASNSEQVLEGSLMLLVYSLGLGIPFILSALLIHTLTGAFQFIKAHYQIIQRLSGMLLIFIGIIMAAGYLNVILSYLTF